MTPKINILTHPNRISKSRIIIHIEAMGDPLSKQRPKFALNKNGHVYTPKQTKEAEEAIGWLVKASKPSLFCDEESLFGVRIIFYQETYQRRDIDNMIKLVLDGCTGIVWEDDTQVVEINAYKFANVGTENAKTEICIYKASSLSDEFASCKWCGKRFRTHPSWVKSGRIYCSRSCSVASQMKRIQKICPYCQKEFRCPTRLSKTKIFCSQDCRSKSNQKEVYCVNCHKPILVTLKKHRVKYCSEGCRIEYNRGIMNKTSKGQQGICVECGKPTSKKKYKLCISCSLSKGKFRYHGEVDRKSPRTEIEIIPIGGA